MKFLAWYIDPNGIETKIMLNTRTLLIPKNEKFSWVGHSEKLENHVQSNIGHLLFFCDDCLNCVKGKQTAYKI